MECRAGGVHPPSKDSVDDFVRQVRGRIRFFSVCGPAPDITSEVSAVLSSMGGAKESGEDGEAVSRPASCPSEAQLREMVQAKNSGAIRRDKDGGE